MWQRQEIQTLLFEQTTMKQASTNQVYVKLLTPALSSFGEERENYFVGRFTQGGSRTAGLPWAIICRYSGALNW